ncbi:UPF0280 family protein [bacterium]|nr:UPF0280 family protein [bacterium]
MRWQRHHFEYKDTIVTILSKPEFFDVAERSLIEDRSLVESTIKRIPDFKTSLSPVKTGLVSKKIIRRMTDAAGLAGIGPMASVAGAFAENALNAVIKAGCSDAIIDNGGDIALFIKEPVHVGIFTGSRTTSGLAFYIEPRKKPFGICTSSGIVGPSLSFGKASAATVISENTALADAAATALGNRINSEEDLNFCFDFLKNIKQIEGALAIFNDKIALWGRLPEIVSSKIDKKIITYGHLNYSISKER